MAEPVTEPVSPGRDPGTTKRSGQSTFAGDVLKLVSGTTFGQGLAILASPILTRLYGPDAFGLAALFVSITSIIGVVACLRYELAIVLPETDEEAVSLLGVSLCFAALVSGMTVPMVWWGRPFILRFLNAPHLGRYLWLVPPAVLVSGLFLALNYWNSRTRRFGRLSVARAGSSVVTTGVQLGAGYLGHPTGGSLIGANVLGSVATTLVLAGQIWRDDWRLVRCNLSWRGMVQALKRHRKFALYDTWSALLNSLSWQLPSLLLSAFFSSAVVGYYALGNRLLRLPMSLVGYAIGQVFFQRAAEAKIDGTLAQVVENAFRRLVMLGMFPTLILTVIGRDLFVVAFGHDWAEAGVYTQILALWTLVWFISSPLHSLFSVLERQELGFVWNVVNFGTRFLALWIGGRLNDSRVAVSLFGASGVFVYGYTCLAIMAASGVPWTKTARILLRNLALFVPGGLILGGLLILRVHSVIRVAVSCALLGGYLVYALRVEPGLLAPFRGVFPRRLMPEVLELRSTQSERRQRSSGAEQ